MDKALLKSKDKALLKSIDKALIKSMDMKHLLPFHTYNLYHYLQSLKCKVDVKRNDKISSNEIIKKKYKKIVISPGPGYPNQAGNCLKIVEDLY